METTKWTERTRGSAQLGTPEPWSAPLWRYLFGPTLIRRPDGEVVLAETRRLGGVVTPADVMRVTGLPRAEAEALLCRIAARHGGDVGVAGEAVLYRFPSLGRARLRPVTPVWQRRRDPDPLTGNASQVDLTLLVLNLLVLIVSGIIILRTLPVSAWQPSAALIPFLLALVALSMPAVRLARRRAHRAEVASENGRRALLRAVLERPAGTALGAHALSHAWVEGAGRAIRPERLHDELRTLGGEPDVDDEARLLFRFPDLDHEARAVAGLRARG